MPERFPKAPDAWEKVERHWTLKKYLGKGKFGTAYVSSKGTVVKVTKDKSEANASALVVGKRIPHVAEIYGVWDAGGGVYVIEQEMIPGKVSKDIESALGDLIATSVQRANRRQDVMDNMIWNAGSWGSMRPNSSPAAASAIAEVGQALRALKKEKITWYDVHAGNVGMKGSEVVVYDLGASLSPGGGKIQVLEREEPMKTLDYATVRSLLEMNLARGTRVAVESPSYIPVEKRNNDGEEDAAVKELPAGDYFVVEAGPEEVILKARNTPAWFYVQGKYLPGAADRGTFKVASLGESVDEQWVDPKTGQAYTGAPPKGVRVPRRTRTRPTKKEIQKVGAKHRIPKEWRDVLVRDYFFYNMPVDKIFKVHFGLKDVVSRDAVLDFLATLLLSVPGPSIPEPRRESFIDKLTTAESFVHVDTLLKEETPVQNEIIKQVGTMRYVVDFIDHFTRLRLGRFKPLGIVTHSGNEVAFKWMRGAVGLQMKIKYDGASDTYSVENVAYGTYTGFAPEVILKSSGIYADQIGDPSAMFPRTRTQAAVKEVKRQQKADYGMGEAISGKETGVGWFHNRKSAQSFADDVSSPYTSKGISSDVYAIWDGKKAVSVIGAVTDKERGFVDALAVKYGGYVDWDLPESVGEGLAKPDKDFGHPFPTVYPTTWIDFKGKRLYRAQSIGNHADKFQPQGYWLTDTQPPNASSEYYFVNAVEFAFIVPTEFESINKAVAKYLKDKMKARKVGDGKTNKTGTAGVLYKFSKPYKAKDLYRELSKRSTEIVTLPEVYEEREASEQEIKAKQQAQVAQARAGLAGLKLGDPVRFALESMILYPVEFTGYWVGELKTGDSALVYGHKDQKGARYGFYRVELMRLEKNPKGKRAPANIMDTLKKAKAQMGIFQESTLFEAVGFSMDDLRAVVGKLERMKGSRQSAIMVAQTAENAEANLLRSAQSFRGVMRDAAFVLAQKFGEIARGVRKESTLRPLIKLLPGVNSAFDYLDGIYTLYSMTPD